MEHLTPFQKQIAEECVEKRNACVCLPMGTGKTVISLALISIIDKPGPALVVCSKTLISTWVSEIHKFFGDSLSYVVYHGDFMKPDEKAQFLPSNDTKLIITTAEAVSKMYTRHRVEPHFVFTPRRIGWGAVPNQYTIPTKPFLTTREAFFFNRTWKCLIIDEIQRYTNIETVSCRALCSVHASFRFCMSGTPINEPKVTRILGYHLLVGDASFPTTTSAASIYITGGKKSGEKYKGLANIMVLRTAAEAITECPLPEHAETITVHEVSKYEALIYTSLKNVMVSMYKSIDKYKEDGNLALVNDLNSSMLTMLLYMRQCIVCPLVPYASILIPNMFANATAGKTNSSVIADLFKKEVEKLDLTEMMNDPDASKSSRIKAAIDTLQKHRNERCIVFNTSVICGDVMKFYTERDARRPVFMLKSENSIQKRIGILDEFESTDNGVLFMTYAIGSDGLNLQKSHVVLCVDAWWNSGVTQQAVARVLRRGQTERVSVYFFTSNLGIEKGLFDKHFDKKGALDSLMESSSNYKVRSMTFKELMLILTKEENTELLLKARNMYKTNPTTVNA